MGEKCCRNCSIWHRFRDKRIFVFYAEIQDGRQNWRENHFLKILSVHSPDTLGVNNFDEITLSCTVSERNAFLCFFAKLQDGRQKWQENDFREKSPADCSYPVGQKFRQNHFILQIEANLCFFHFWQKCENSKWPSFFVLYLTRLRR